jgi:hypothetical protein
VPIDLEIGDLVRVKHCHQNDRVQNLWRDGPTGFVDDILRDKEDDAGEQNANGCAPAIKLLGVTADVAGGLDNLGRAV